MTTAFARAGLAILWSAAAWGQASAEPPRFDVASVKPAVRRPPAAGGVGERTGPGGAVSGLGGCPTSMNVDPARVDFRCVTVAMLIGYAYRFSPDRVTGPDWMMALSSPRFDIVARIPPGASEHQVPEMFQALLADRFGLVLHRTTANLPIYALVVAKGGLKMKEAAPEAAAADVAAESGAPPPVDGFYGATQSRTIPNADGGEAVTLIGNPRMGTVRQTGDPFRIQRWEAAGISFAGLADLLDHVAPLPSPIVDLTGLQGRYQMVLEVSLADLPAARRLVPAAGDRMADTEETVLRGFNDGLLKLGLHLERRKAPIETLVVDRVEKTPAEN